MCGVKAEESLITLFVGPPWPLDDLLGRRYSSMLAARHRGCLALH